METFEIDTSLACDANPDQMPQILTRCVRARRPSLAVPPSEPPAAACFAGIERARGVELEGETIEERAAELRRLRYGCPPDEPDCSRPGPDESERRRRYVRALLREWREIRARNGWGA